MGCSQYTKCSDPKDSFGKPTNLGSSNISRNDDGDFSALPDPDNSCNELESKTHLTKMIWDFGLACFTPSCLSNEQLEENNPTQVQNDVKMEHNKAWLLAETGRCAGDQTNGDPHSVHSSFRFSLCSQLELDSLKVNCSTSTTILMVNLDNNLPHSRSKEVKWGRFDSLERTISPVASSLVRFSYDEILSATRNFSEGRVLGRGALSYVYRGRVGFLRTVVAIKRLDKEDKESPKAFCRELMIANSLEHPNVVPLLGFCIDPDGGLFLVYKYVSSGSLEHHLCEKKRGAKGFALLPWSVRYKVATGIAEAIAYLHNGTERCVVHRDIKPSNILLSSKRRPKLCDFGLATWTPGPSVPFLCKTVKGTFGYLAPEYFQHGKISDKTDVYAFGVVLLELLTGRKPIEANRPPGEENLVDWAKPFLDLRRITDLEQLLDPRAKFTPKSSVQISRMAKAASACIQSEESNRPGMIEIISLLRGEESFCYVNLKNGPSTYTSRRYSQNQQMKNEITNHLAVAMLGVAELEDDDYFYGR